MLQKKSLYFHIPFCIKRCSYCDFTTYAGMESWIPEYFKTLQREICLARLEVEKDTLIHSIFFGGGTPSIVPACEYKTILQQVNSQFKMADLVETSLEANPGALHERDLRRYRDMGFNRISLGVQSFHEAELKLLGRIHGNRETYEAVVNIRAAGFDNMSLDLIYGLPGQTLPLWKENIKRALDFNPEHISMYCLTIEEDTPLYEAVKSGEIIPLEDDVAAEMYELAIQDMTEAGYRHYEISNWAKIDTSGADFRCLHNLQYWRNEEYYGFGAGAHGYLRNMRVANNDIIPIYINK